MDVYTKQPDEVLDYDFDFSQWMPTGDSLPADVSASVVTAEAGITRASKTHPGSSVVKQWLSGGTDGADYKITCEITTTEGRVKETEILIRVREL